MRIIAGRHRGRRLAAPEGLAVRPTADRTREALFNILATARFDSDSAAFSLAGSHVLDAFAGSGALGLEALSRGAAEVVFMESHATALEALGRNIAALNAENEVQVLRCDVLAPPPAERPYNLILMDPPYNQGLAPPAIEALQARGWVAPGALLVVELMAEEPLEPPPGFSPLQERRYGKARLVFLRAEP